MEISDRVFTDSNYFVALFYPYDPLHQEAQRFARSLTNSNLSLVTSNFIFLETVTVLSQRAGKTVGREAGLYLRNNSFITVAHIDELLHEQTWLLFQKLQDKNISFVDCSTIAVMKAEHINRLLTFNTTNFRKLRREHNFSFSIYEV